VGGGRRGTNFPLDPGSRAGGTIEKESLNAAFNKSTQQNVT
jgi:hypothetical protein